MSPKTLKQNIFSEEGFLKGYFLHIYQIHQTCTKKDVVEGGIYPQCNSAKHSNVVCEAKLSIINLLLFTHNAIRLSFQMLCVQ